MSAAHPIYTLFLVLGILALVVLWFVLLFGSIILLVKHLSRWKLLVERYPFQPPQEGFRTHYQTVMVGPVRFKRCVSVYISQAGLGLQVSLPGLTPVTIPWSEFTSAVPARYFWQRAVRLTIGAPPVTTLTLPEPLYRETVAYAGPNVLPAPG